VMRAAKSPQQMIGECCRLIATGRVLQAITCLFAAACLYFAIDAWLLRMPFTSAINTALAFYQWTIFESQCGSITRLHKTIADLRELAARIERGK
jgi:hypothetical protein